MLYSDILMMLGQCQVNPYRLELDLDSYFHMYTHLVYYIN